MCNSRNCRHKKKPPPEPKFFAQITDEYGTVYSEGGETPNEAVKALQEEVSYSGILGIKVYEVFRAGTASITIEWDK